MPLWPCLVCRDGLGFVWSGASTARLSYSDSIFQSSSDYTGRHILPQKQEEENRRSFDSNPNRMKTKRHHVERAAALFLFIAFFGFPFFIGFGFFSYYFFKESNKKEMLGIDLTWTPQQIKQIVVLYTPTVTEDCMIDLFFLFVGFPCVPPHHPLFKSIADEQDTSHDLVWSSSSLSTYLHTELTSPIHQIEFIPCNPYYYERIIYTHIE